MEKKKFDNYTEFEKKKNTHTEAHAAEVVICKLVLRSVENWFPCW